MSDRGTAAVPRRVRLACRPCRRKKSRCPGQRPVCSLCARLEQPCTYDKDRNSAVPGFDGDRQASRIQQSGPARAPDVSNSVDIQERLGSLESTLAELIGGLSHQRDFSHPLSSAIQSPTSAPVRRSEINVDTDDALPPWEVIVPVIELYTKYCDSQPLPLFCCKDLIDTIKQRDREVLFAILALSIRFSDDAFFFHAGPSLSKKYSEISRRIVMQRVSEGPVELSTLQSLVLLALVDFSNGELHRSEIHSGLALTLAQCANLTRERVSRSSGAPSEERRRCVWSIMLLRQLYGYHDRLSSRLSDLPYPESVGKPPENFDNTSVTNVVDRGIVAYVLRLGDQPPWSPQSEYAEIMAMLSHLGVDMPPAHRYNSARPGDRTAAFLESNRAYWGPWFLSRFLYHTALCALNHPLLISLQLRKFGALIPDVFLLQSSYLLSTHTNWISHYLTYFSTKGYKVSDPFLGYCAAIVATVELQLSFTDDLEARLKKQESFSRCVAFVEGFGDKWPHMSQIAEKLHLLTEFISTSYGASHTATGPSLKIDLSRFWEILNYSSASSNVKGNPPKRIFGTSLLTYSLRKSGELSDLNLPPRAQSIVTMNPDPLPEPVINQWPSLAPPLLVPGSNTVSDRNPTVVPENIQLDDQSLLQADQFFAQGQYFGRDSSDWWTSGGL